MKKDEIFFGQDGLTSTSANFIANICKEQYAQLEAELSNIVFYTTTFNLIGTDQQNLLCDGIKDVSDIKPKLEKVAKLKSLIAWLREAIKAKDRLFDEAKRSTYEDFGIEIPEEPEKKRFLTADEIVGEWNIKQRNRYYYLDTLCAQIGQYIHPNGDLAAQRKKLMEVMCKPHKVDGSGRDTVVYNYEPSVNIDEVERLYMQLQSEYRGYQAELNSMKHEIETALQNDKALKDSEYAKAYQAYNAKLKEAVNLLEINRNELLMKLQTLKIIIPDSLKPVYDEVSKVAKK